MVEEASLRVVRCGGSELNFRRAVFSADSKYIFCVSGDFIKVYSTATEECVHILHGHSDLVTGIQLNPNNHLQLYSCSFDGTIKLWDYIDGILIKTFIVGHKLHALFTVAHTEDSVFVTINKEKPDTFQLVSVKLPKSSSQEIKAKEISFVLDYINQSPKCIAFGNKGEYVAAVRDFYLSVYFFKKKTTSRFTLSSSRNKKHAKNNFTCVACHPKEDCVASGHKDGKIRLWRNFDDDKKYTYTCLHWHHDMVMDLAFSVTGTSLLSGGRESVLVEWRNATEKNKEFLPRLGATIEHISVSPAGDLFCTSHSDNKIVVIHRNLEASAVIQGLVKDRNIFTGLMIDPRTRALVLNGKPGHLQFYSLQSDKQLYNLDIVQQEYINDTNLIQIELTKAAFGCQGHWLATVEQWQEKETELELQMKLWAYNKKTQGFILNTKVSMPHEDHITALCFCNAEKSENPTLVTASKDGHFKVWILTDDSDIYKKAVGWTCDFVGSYHKYQATNCCFSEDGSLLAVSFEEIVTIWDSETWELKCTFCQRAGKIRHLCFGRLTCSKYLLGATENDILCCWNLLSCTLEWSTKLNVSVMGPDPNSENIAAISQSSVGSDLFVFKPSEPRPVYIQKNISREEVHWGVFIPRDVPESFTSEAYQWLNRSQFYFLTKSQSLLTFSAKSPEEKLTPTSKQLLAEESLPTTPFYFILGKHRQQQDEKLNDALGNELVQLPLTENIPAISELLHTPAHVLPSASFLCSMFINSLLLSKESKSAEEIPDDVDMEEEKESEDSDEENDFTEKVQDTDSIDLGEDIMHQLSKSEEKELRKLRKVDYSWITAL
ncbi:WD repeat-containing protein 75 isoform X1 [Loxodonta africana]|uniref:WD repeat-containing protein 75 isoform X1 n=1 Tax=Loxodonta africana TaxID=9785 RepID=UPI0002233936|nr:WD repeat-containing protein 75 [Loxodonta africana]